MFTASLVGDQLLTDFSRRIQRYIHSHQSNSHAFARLSGDEFSILYRDIDPARAELFAIKILASLKEPFILGNHQIYVHVSMGIAHADNDISNFEDILVRADAAMYYAKKSGKNQFKVFNESVSQDIFFRKQTAEKIKNAIIQNQFHLHYMPILDSHSLDIVSVEILLRCNAEDLTGIGPDIYIPIAEEFGLIKSIDLWVIEASFKQIAQEIPFLNEHPLVFCINISAIELHNPLFCSQLQSLLALYQIDPSWIELEITETSLVAADEMSINTLQSIHALGVNLALDDFGTGYTAFSQLGKYPIDTLKIDKSFVDNMLNDPNSLIIIESCVNLAKRLKLKTLKPKRFSKLSKRIQKNIFSKNNLKNVKKKSKQTI